MDRLRFKAILREFPILSELDKRFAGSHVKDCDEIRIERIDRNLLARRGRSDVVLGSAVDVNSWSCYTVVRDGKFEQLTQDVSSQSNYAHEGGSSSEGESVLEGLDRLGWKSVDLIVFIAGGYEIEGHFSTSRWKAVVFKPSKRLDLAEELQAAREVAANKVAAECAAV